MKRALSDTELMRAQELLVQRATEGLAPHDAAELDRLGATDVFELDAAAAALDLATLPRERMPADLAAAILARTPSGLRASPSTAPAVPAVAATLPEREPHAVRAPSLRVRPAPASNRRLAPWIMAAASLALAAGAWVFAATRPPQVVERPRRDDPTSGVAGGPAIAAAPDRVRAPLVFTFGGAAGEVVWSDREQRGLVQITGIAPNDATRERYQVWIYDGARDARYPVDGGLFDAEGGAVTVMLSPRLLVAQPTRFVITREHAAGAVVSTLAHVVATADVGR